MGPCMFSSNNQYNVHIYLLLGGYNVFASRMSCYQSHLHHQCKALGSWGFAWRGHELSRCCPDGVGIENPDLPQCRLLHFLLPQLSSPSQMLEGCRCCHQVVGGLVGPLGRRLDLQTALGKMILIFPYFSSLTPLLSSQSISQVQEFEVSK